MIFRMTASAIDRKVTNKKLRCLTGGLRFLAVLVSSETASLNRVAFFLELIFVRHQAPFSVSQLSFAQSRKRSEQGSLRVTDSRNRIRSPPKAAFYRTEKSLRAPKAARG
jgi:hypothetical protein